VNGASVGKAGASALVALRQMESVVSEQQQDMQQQDTQLEVGPEAEEVSAALDKTAAKDDGGQTQEQQGEGTAEKGGAASSDDAPSADGNAEDHVCFVCEEATEEAGGFMVKRAANEHITCGVYQG
jgi:hypothetical protein